MSYRINKTDGSVLTNLLNGSIDQISTDLTLIGGDYTGYGEYFNENLVHLLENFANSEAPSNPIVGQLWWDTSESRGKIYNGVDFVAIGTPIVQNLEPLTLTAGDLWLNPDENQLWVYDGVDLILIGPQFKRSQGISGFQVETIADQNNGKHTVVFLYANDQIMGFISNTEFAPTDLNVFSPYQGNTVKPGLTLFQDYTATFNQIDLTLNDGGGNVRYDGFIRLNQSGTGNLELDAIDSTNVKHDIDVLGSRILGSANPILLSLDVTGSSDIPADCNTMLNGLAPPNDSLFPEIHTGSVSRIWVFDTVTPILPIDSTYSFVVHNGDWINFRYYASNMVSNPGDVVFYESQYYTNTVLDDGTNPTGPFNNLNFTPLTLI